MTQRVQCMYSAYTYIYIYLEFVRPKWALAIPGLIDFVSYFFVIRFVLPRHELLEFSLRQVTLAIGLD